MSHLAIFYPKNRAQDGIKRSLAANTAEEVQLPGRYTCFRMTCLSSSADEIYFILHEATGQADPTMLSGDGANGSLSLAPGQQLILVIPDNMKTAYIRFKSPGIGTIKMDGFDPANVQGAML